MAHLRFFAAPAGQLGNGQLRRQVAEWLAARPGPHTPGEIAKGLGRSAGAVGNALTTLAAAITPKAPAPPKPPASPASPKPAVRAREPQITAGRRVRIDRKRARPYDGTGDTAPDPFSRPAQYGRSRPRGCAASGYGDRHRAGLLPRADGTLRSPPGSQKRRSEIKRRSANAGDAEVDA